MSHEIHFVTGKGGVGKSIVALSLAYKKSLQSKKVLLVELGDESFYKDVFNKPEIGYKPTTLRPFLDVCLWSGAEALKEYAKYLLKVEALYKIFIENPVSRSLINVAPALPEIAVMGKITSISHRHGPPMDYDCLIIDAYSTGHFLSLVKASRSLSQAVKVGPMGQQNREIDGVLRDSSICHYHIVSLPEELPVRESEELFQELKSFLEIKADFYINKMIETDLTAAELKKSSKGSGSVAEFAGYMESVLERQSDAVEKLKKFKTSVTNLPRVTEPSPWAMVELLADRMPS
jgi:anion-transporting  ArsA/GET3 family ATPase